MIDGEAVGCGHDDVANFEMMRDWRHGDSVFMFGFDLIELNGEDVRHDPPVPQRFPRMLGRAAGGAMLEA